MLLTFIMGFALLLPSAVYAAPTETILARLSGGAGGVNPSELVMDSTGALYGTAVNGGDAGCGSPNRTGCGLVFKAAPPAPGQTAWVFSVLHKFQGGDDGNFPVGLSIDANGDLFGAASLGAECFDCGTVFMLTPPPSGQANWSYQVLHHFAGGTDGANPNAAPTVSASGVLYGTTNVGGSPRTCPNLSSGSCGTVYRLTPPTAGASAWSYAVAYRFKGNSSGSNPLSGLYEAPDRTLYGTTVYGGLASNDGTVFALGVPGSGGTALTHTVIHRFAGGGRENPNSPLTGDAAGNLYGVVGDTVFKLVPPAAGHGPWRIVSLHRFSGGPNGGGPGSVLVAANGSLYGSASTGGYGCMAYSGCGLTFELTPPIPGQIVWPLHILHRFRGGLDGFSPRGGLIEDGHGNLFGSTYFGGKGCAGNTCGAVFEIAR